MKHCIRPTLAVVLFILAIPATAEVLCTGTIVSVYKWHSMDRLSIWLSSANRWVSMPTSSDESMALMAFAASKPVEIYWSATDVTSCTDGWDNNRSLQGYFLVKNQ